jgi:hypothetical protein
MFNVALQDVGDGFDASMGMPGKSLDVVLWIIRPEIVQHQKWVECRNLGKAKGPFEVYSSTLNCWFALQDLGYLSSFNHSYSPLASIANFISCVYEPCPEAHGRFRYGTITNEDSLSSLQHTFRILAFSLSA